MQYESRHHSSAGPKKHTKKLTREDFKKDLEEAVKQGTKAMKTAKPKDAAKGKKSGYDGMSVAELRKLLNGKKRNLLVKSGFPDGKLPRSKAGMIALCKKLKRKRW